MGGNRKNSALCICLMAAFSLNLTAASLPSAMNGEEIGRAIKVFGTGSGMRLLRSSDPLPAWPGFKAGIELTLQPMGDLNLLGARNGTLPTFFPMPRFYFAKGLGSDAEIIVGTFPFVMNNTVASYGALLKWTLRPEDENFLATSVYASYTRMMALDDTLRAHTIEAGISISKDFVRLRPYGGVAFALSTGDINPSPGSNITKSGTVTAFKVFVGFELELPMSLSLQLDFADLVPAASMLVGFRL